MRAMLLFVVASAALLSGCFISPDENRIDQHGTDTGCDPGGDVIEGMGDTCADEGDCPSGAPYCFTNPTDTTETGCTIQNCKPGACPTCYECCDCSTAMPGMILCLPVEETAELEGICTCS